MARVTLLKDDENDACAWYLDGVYVGHDDQVTAEDVMRWLGAPVLDTDLSCGQWPDTLPV